MLSVEKYSLFLEEQEKYPEHSELIGRLLEIAFIHKGNFPKNFNIPGEYKPEVIALIMRDLNMEVQWSTFQESFRYYRKSTYIHLNISEDYKEL